MPYRLHIQVEGLPKSANSRMHWSARHRENKKWYRRVAEQVNITVGWPSEPLTFVSLTLIRHSASEPDPDNLAGSMKPIIDGLQRCGVLADDKSSNFVDGRPHFLWVKAPPRKGFVEVILEEAAN